MGVLAGKLAARLDTLDGKTIAFIWDHVFRGDELFPLLEDELVTRFPTLQVIGYDVFGNSHGGDEAKFIDRLPDSLATRAVDAVVSGMGC